MNIVRKIHDLFRVKTIAGALLETPEAVSSLGAGGSTFITITGGGGTSLSGSGLSEEDRVKLDSIELGALVNLDAFSKIQFDATSIDENDLSSSSNSSIIANVPTDTANIKIVGNYPITVNLESVSLFNSNTSTTTGTAITTYNISFNSSNNIVIEYVDGVLLNVSDVELIQVKHKEDILATYQLSDITYTTSDGTITSFTIPYSNTDFSEIEFCKYETVTTETEEGSTTVRELRVLSTLPASPTKQSIITLNSLTDSFWNYEEDENGNKFVWTDYNVYSTKDVSAYGRGTDLGDSYASNLYELKDVVLTNLSNNDLLIYDSSTSKWVNINKDKLGISADLLHTLTISINGVTQATYNPASANASVNISTITLDEVTEYIDLKIDTKLDASEFFKWFTINYDSSNNVVSIQANFDFYSIGGVSAYGLGEGEEEPSYVSELGLLSDVTLTNVALNNILLYDGSKWVNKPMSSIVVDAYTKSEIDTKLSSIFSEISTLKSNVTSILSNITSIQGDITNVLSNIATIENSISGITSDISTINATISNILTTLTGKLDKDDFFTWFTIIKDTSGNVVSIQANFDFYGIGEVSAYGLGDIGGSGRTTLATLDDVSLSNLVTNDMLTYNGSKWVNIPMSQVRGVTSWADLENKPTTLSGFGITDAYTSSQVDSKIASVSNLLGNYLPLSGGTMTGVITAATTAGTNGGILLGTTYLTSISGSTIFYKNNAIRFGTSGTWSYGDWAGLKYNTSNNTLYLGLPDNNIFAGTAVSGIIKTPSVTAIYVGDTNYVYHLGNLSGDGTWITLSSNTISHNIAYTSNQTLSKDDGKFVLAYTIDKAGHITGIDQRTLLASDIPNLDWSKITTGKPTTLEGYGITDGTNSVTISGTGNAITSATISGHILTLIKGDTFLLQSTFDDLFEKVNIGTTASPVYAIKAKYHFYSVGEVSAYEFGEYSGGGASTLAELEDVQLTSLSSDDILKYNGSKWVNIPITEVKGATSWNEIENKPTTFTPSAHTHTVVDITDISTLTLQVNGSNLATFNGKANVTANISVPTKLSQLTDDVVSGKYLPLSGGTISGTLNAPLFSAQSGGIYTNYRLYLPESASSAISTDRPRFGRFDRAAGSAVLQLGTSNIFDVVDSSYSTTLLRVSSSTFTYKGTSISLNGHTHSQYLTAHQTIYGLTLQANGTTLGTYTPNSAAKTFNITYANVGAAAASHTHTFASLTSKPTTISGYGITDALKSYGLTGAVDLDTIKTNGTYYISYEATNRPTYFSEMLCMRNGDTNAQLVISYNSSGCMYYRGGNDSSGYYGWRTVLDTNNYNSYAPTLTGTGASGTWGISISGNSATATNADMLDGYHASSFALQGSVNNLIAFGNEFTFAPSGFSGGIYFNYRTAGGANGNITEYYFGNGKGGNLGTALHTGNYNSYAPTLTGTGASGTWGINISGNAATATNADTLDGVHYQNILERASSGFSNSGTSTGWFRIAETKIIDVVGVNFLLSISRNFMYLNNESYLFAISIAYGGNISITQLSGCANSNLITKIRIDYKAGSIAYIDLYIGASSTNNGYFWYTVGGATSYTSWTANPTLNGTAYEFTTVNGCKSDKGFTAVGNIAATGEVTAYSSSDIRLKTNLNKLNALSVVRKLGVYSFDWNEEALQLRVNKNIHDYGLIAQLVQLYIPEVINYNMFNKGYLGIDYLRLVPFTISAIKEVDDEVTKLKKRVKQLEKKLQKYESTEVFFTKRND